MTIDHRRVFSDIHVSIPGEHRTYFVSLEGDRKNDRPKVGASNQGTAGRKRRNYQSPEVENRINFYALRQRKVCLFHARGFDGPHKLAAVAGGRRFAHNEDVVP